MGSLGLTDSARFEIDFRLKIKERDYREAPSLPPTGLSFEAVADDGLVIGGQGIALSLLAVNRGAADVEVSDVTITGLRQRCPARLLASGGTP